jgi:membrane-associated phospholipid phosphatase
MKRNPGPRAPKIPMLRPLILLVLLMLVIGAIAGRSQTIEANPLQSQTNPDCRANPFLPNRCPAPAQIEPRAGTWRTWVLEDGSQFRNQITGPPSRAVSHEEIAVLQQLARQRDAAALDLINFWDAGGPAYRWNEIATDQLIRNNVNTPRGARMMALVNVAIYDAMIAAWDLKYLHKRPRPSELDPGFSTVLANPQSPSYPSEHAVAAGAASAVLAYLFPGNAKFFADQAEAAGRSRLLAGVQFPSDVAAGLELGRAVAELVIARGRTDGSDAVFTGAIPTGPCAWRGTNPAEPMTGTWRTWTLSSGGELRPGPPPTCDSAQMAKELAEVKNFPRTIPAPGASFNTTRAAFYWQGNAIKIWHDILGKKLLEYRLDANPPRAARAYALFSVAGYDAAVAGWDEKYTYWAIRPFMLDPTVNPLFTTPNHPSYPSAHAFIDAPHATVLAYLFPRDADFFEAQSREGAESRIWAGIHFRSDIEAGLSLGRAVAEKVIERARNDGSQ